MMKNKPWIKIAGIALLTIVIILGALRIVFDEKFDDFERYIESRENYEGGKEEFDRNFERMAEWKENYRRENPDASDEEVDRELRKTLEFVEALENQKKNSEGN